MSFRMRRQSFELSSVAVEAAMLSTSALVQLRLPEAEAAAEAFESAKVF